MTKELEQRVTSALNNDGTSIEEQDEIWELSTPIRLYHPPTFKDSLKVGLISRNIAYFMHVDPKESFRSGLLHDIGKIGIPLELLNKFEGWTEEDYEKIKPHTQIGYDILISRGLVIPAWVALTHHCCKKENPYPEKLPDYPSELKSNGKRFVANLFSRIVSLADQYDALHRRNDMNGREPLTQEQVRENLINGNPDISYLINELYKFGILPDKLLD